MIVCIAEKPSVAADIAKIIGATHHHRVGRNAGYYEGNGYQVTWTFGHLCELKNPEEYSPYWKAWSLAALPMVPERFGIRLKEGVEEQFNVIEQLFAKAERIINCGDAGQEGELIQRWVMQKAGATCPVERLWISSMTEEAIREGFARLRPQSDYQGLYEAGLCRAIGDWLLGMNATRLYTLKYGDNNRRRGAQPLSIGRVQTPTLAMIVERQHEIQNFQPEPYWVLSTIYRDVTFTARLEADDEDDKPQNNDETEGKSPANKSLAKRGFTNREEAEAALKAIEGTPFTVQKVTQKKGTEAPPRLFDLTSLQVECNKKFGYGADLTLQLIQQLYENKFTTYPRVDTTYLPDDMYDRCPAILKGIRDYHVGRTQPLTQWLEPLRHAPLRKSKKVFDNAKITDHHAIIPTGVLPQGLTDVQRNVYDLIVQRFVAVFYPDCRFATTTVDGEAAGIPFRASGKVIVDEGWRVLFPKANATREGGANAASSSSSAAGEGGAAPQAGNAGAQRSDDERTLPPFQKGETGPHTPTLTQKETTPPKPFTEATLLRAMETAGRNVDDEELREAMKENGIGRPSTRAAIIQTLYKRGYIRLQRKSLEATPTGVALIGLIQEDLLKSAELTGIWENKLRQIEHHTYSAQQFMAELKQMVSELVHTVLCDNTNRRVQQAPAPSGNASSAGKSSAKQGTSSPSAPSSPTGNSSSSSENATSSSVESNGEAKPKRKIIRAGSKCPQCGEGKVIKGHTAYGCSRWKEGCNWRKPF
ncbi:DNA topoisomerase 3 [Ihuprevotella massiliensis]|uniref:DNA topoisomerase 3 n=1 Tax=Ihuprevotella massiliensis TaxID=1852368 RepID=UPI00094F35D9